jgi:hypothetical protein
MTVAIKEGIMSESMHAVVIAMGMRYRKVDRIADWQFVAVSRGLVHATASAAAGGMDFVLDYIEAPLPRGNGLWLLPVTSANRLDITKVGPWRRLTQCELSMVANGTFGKWMPGHGILP